MTCFLLKFVLFLQLTNCIHRQFGADATQSEMFERMSKIEAHNQPQDKEISLLKTKAIEDRSEIRQLRDRLAHFDALAFTNFQSEDNLERQKRPYRLLPSQQLLNRKDVDRKKEEEPAINQFYGPPTSCSELNALGHTLNGFYLVKAIKNSSNKSGIQVNYCQFQQIGEKRPIETKTGVVDVKTSSVHFFVRRKGEFSNDYGRNKMINFVVLAFNEGNGVDWDNQWFRAPYPGTYFFSITGSKDYHSSDRVSICVRLNGKDIGEALSSSSTYYGSFSHQFSFKLNANDKIELELSVGTVYSIHFTGWMVKQDLLI